MDSLASREIPVARAENDSIYLLQLLRHSGCTRAAFGMARQAEPELHEVCTLAAAISDTTTWLQGLRWFSVAVGQQGRTAEARKSYLELGDLARSFGDSLHVGWSELGLAYDHYLGGRSEAAIKGYGRAAGILERRGVTKGALWARNGQGMALRQEGQYAAAARCFQRSLGLAVSLDDKLSEAMALNYLGRLEILLGDPGLAIGYFERAAFIHHEYQHHREGLLPLLDIAQAKTMQGCLHEAEEGLESIISQAALWGLRDIEMLGVLQLADVHLARKRPGRAVQLCRDAMSAQEFPSAMVRTEISLRLARALAVQGHHEEALAVLDPVSGEESAATTLELRVCRQRANSLLALHRVDSALECALAGIHQARTSGFDPMLMPLNTLAARAWYAKGMRDSALVAIDRGVSQWERARTLAADPRWRELRSESAGELFTQGAVMMLAGEEGPGGAFNLIQRYKARTLVERMQTPGRDIETSIPRISVHELQTRILKPGMIFWEVVTDEESSVFILVTQDKILGHVIARGDETFATMQKLTDVLTSSVIKDLLPAQTLAGILVQSLPKDFRETLLEAQRLVWSPDGFWHAMPLALLRKPSSEGLLQTQCELSRIPCASLLKSGKQPTDHVVPSSEILIIQGSLQACGENFPGVIQEVNWLKDRFENVRLGSAAMDGPEEGFAWKTKGIIHVAAHTQVDDEQPWNTTIVLGSDEKSKFKATEVAQWNLEAGLTVLASCRSAGSRIVGGEGMLGLTSAFLVAGVPSVVATLWPVNDGATAVFMARFYNNLAEGKEVSTALRLAQNECRLDPRLNSARYWAGFVVVGNGAQQIPLQW